MLEKYSAGENIASHCTKCKLVLDHTIVAMDGETIAKVKCKTCGSAHKYRSAEDAKKIRTRGRRKMERKTRKFSGKHASPLQKAKSAITIWAPSIVSVMSWTIVCSARESCGKFISTNAMCFLKTRNGSWHQRTRNQSFHTETGDLFLRSLCSCYLAAFMHKSKILITCAKGIPPFLKTELLSLGFPVLSEHLSGVETEGTLADTLLLNLSIRTGHRVLFAIKEFEAKNADDLYREVNAVSWEGIIPEAGYLSVSSSVENVTIRDSRYASLKCKDAIVDRIKEKTGKRPDSGPERGGCVVHLFWKDERCIVYLDTSGEPLSRRGYRKIPLAAPMQETLAAAVIIASGWNGNGNFINPMCGSGTLAIEAALIGLNRAAGLQRNNFGFMHVKGFEEQRWQDLLKTAKKNARKSILGRIIATDISPEAMEAAKKNAMTAGVEHLIEFSVCDYADTPLPGSGLIVMNPPYGERIGEIAKLEETYKGIGDFFKQKCKGYTGYVFTGNPALAKKVSLKPKRSIPFFNSGIECRLLEYELYEGTRKVKKVKAE